MASITLIDNTYVTPSTYKITGVNLKSTVTTFKQLIQNQTSNLLLSGVLNLTFNSQVLINTNTLESYGITSDSTITNISSIIFLSTDNGTKTYNIASIGLNETLSVFNFKCIINYKISPSNLITLYFNDKLLKSSDILSRVGIKYGSTIISKTSGVVTSQTTSQSVTTQAQTIPQASSPKISSSEIYVEDPEANPVSGEIINDKQTVTYTSTISSSTISTNAEIISTSPNLIVTQEFKGVIINEESNPENSLVKNIVDFEPVEEVIISESKISPTPITIGGTKYYKYSVVSLNPNTKSDESTLVNEVVYTINNPEDSSLLFSSSIGITNDKNGLC